MVTKTNTLYYKNHTNVSTINLGVVDHRLSLVRNLVAPMDVGIIYCNVNLRYFFSGNIDINVSRVSEVCGVSGVTNLGMH